MGVNKGRVDANVEILSLTKYAKSRPDSMMLAAAAIHHTTNEEDEDATTTYPNGETPNGASTEHKLKLLGDHVGQTLGGSEKLCGEIVNQHLRRAFDSVDVWSLIVDFSTDQAEVS